MLLLYRSIGLGIGMLVLVVCSVEMMWNLCVMLCVVVSMWLSGGWCSIYWCGLLSSR